MTAPRWIAEAIEAAYDNGPGDGKLVTALIERLPLEAMARVLTEAQGNRGDQLAAILGVLTDGDPEVVELTELYQGASRALDEAGVPYAINVEIPPHIVIEATIGELAPRKEAEVHQVPAHPGTLQLGLPDRIRWLAQQRPIRAELESVQATRDLAEKMATKYQQERDELKAALALSRELHQNAERAFADAVAERGGARAQLVAVDRALEAAGVPLEVRSKANDLPSAVAWLAAERDWLTKSRDADYERHKADRADQAAYIEQLEIEITALEEEIWEDAP